MVKLYRYRLVFLNMETFDDSLVRFEATGAPSLPPAAHQGWVENEGARIWYAAWGTGTPVLLLHGGLGHSGNWGNQVHALMLAGHRVIVVDSRGHGRSTRDTRPYSYALMASDVLAVMDHLSIDRAALIGWSDGACTALILADTVPLRVASVFFFACNMDPSGAKPFEATPALQRCFARHAMDYQNLSATPGQFTQFVEDVGLMQRTQPDYSREDLARITIPVTIVHSEHDEFIRREHAEYLAQSIPGASFLLLKEVSHFAPLQRPNEFNRAVLSFLDKAHRSQDQARP